MYTKVLTIIALIFTKHAKGQDDSCEFPCELRGQTLNIFSGNTMRGTWTFNNDGMRSEFIFGLTTDNLICYQRVERFIIFRTENEDKFTCYIFDYNPGMQQLSFSFGFGATFTTTNPNVCNLCTPNGGIDPYLATVSGTNSDTASLPCETVSVCTGATPCDANDTLPDGCPPSTTTIPTTTEETTQPTKRCHKRRHRH